eukprot:TRINITY_DN1407_c0_g1_i2.p1 TRINITY_DN1407_c0_g1~~TRINITY_DN1407_c0_g1_i2.p1  ORF type:complete len:750 (+),score=57.17 TRINITY_DN1407_c0_g1_i2:211-2460(+)
MRRCFTSAISLASVASMVFMAAMLALVESVRLDDVDFVSSLHAGGEVTSGKPATQNTGVSEEDCRHCGSAVLGRFRKVSLLAKVEVVGFNHIESSLRALQVGSRIREGITAHRGAELAQAGDDVDENWPPLESVLAERTVQETWPCEADSDTVCADCCTRGDTDVDMVDGSMHLTRRLRSGNLCLLVQASDNITMSYGLRRPEWCKDCEVAVFNNNGLRRADGIDWQRAAVLGGIGRPNSMSSLGDQTKWEPMQQGKVDLRRGGVLGLCARSSGLRNSYPGDFQSLAEITSLSLIGPRDDTTDTDHSAAAGPLEKIADALHLTAAGPLEKIADALHLTAAGKKGLATKKDSQVPSPVPTAEPTAIPQESPEQPSEDTTTTSTTKPLVTTLCPTVVPTLAPSSAPTPCVPCSPTPCPTIPPTPIPTPSPTLAPTTLPTPCPTLYPTPCPTLCPTPCPTLCPTPSPTLAPTPPPTPQPTPRPTVCPTPCPTVCPTPCPTPVPSPCPTLCPTPCPTLSPSPCPTPRPTQSPTQVPSPCPTPCQTTLQKSPTPNPTASPTPNPTSATHNPTANPTHIPTPRPSVQIPTPIPTLMPTPLPTPGPTALPTLPLPRALRMAEISRLGPTPRPSIQGPTPPPTPRRPPSCRSPTTTSIVPRGDGPGSGAPPVTPLKILKVIQDTMRTQKKEQTDKPEKDKIDTNTLDSSDEAEASQPSEKFDAKALADAIAKLFVEGAPRVTESPEPKAEAKAEPSA